MQPLAMPAKNWCSRASMSVAEIGAPHRLIAPDLVGAAGERDPAGLEQVRAVREVEREARVLFDQQHGHPVLAVDLAHDPEDLGDHQRRQDRKSTRLNSSHQKISYAVFCLKKKNNK